MDTNESIGSGHLSRCLSLSEFLLNNEFVQNNNSLEKFGAHLLMHLIKK